MVIVDPTAETARDNNAINAACGSVAFDGVGGGGVAVGGEMGGVVVVGLRSCVILDKGVIPAIQIDYIQLLHSI